MCETSTSIYVWDNGHLREAFSTSRMYLIICTSIFVSLTYIMGPGHENFCPIKFAHRVEYVKNYAGEYDSTSWHGGKLAVWHAANGSNNAVWLVLLFHLVFLRRTLGSIRETEPRANNLAAKPSGNDCRGCKKQQAGTKRHSSVSRVQSNALGQRSAVFASRCVHIFCPGDWRPSSETGCNERRNNISGWMDIFLYIAGFPKFIKIWKLMKHRETWIFSLKLFAHFKVFE